MGSRDVNGHIPEEESSSPMDVRTNQRPLTQVGFWRSENEPDFPDPLELVDSGWLPEERQVVALYLDSGTEHAAYKGWSDCRICGIMNGSRDLTDDIWLWPEGLSHYVRIHSVRPPAEFLKHVYSSEKGKILIAHAAANALRAHLPNLSIFGDIDSSGNPCVMVGIPKGSKPGHVPDGILGVAVEIREICDQCGGVVDHRKHCRKCASGKQASMASESVIHIAEALRRIATSLEASENPSLPLLELKLRLLLAAVEENLVLVFQADPYEENETMQSDDGSIQDSIDLELMQAGAVSVNWESDTMYVVVPPGSKVAVLKAFNDMKEGESGDEVQAFLKTLDLSDKEKAAPAIKAASSFDFHRMAARIARKRILPSQSKPIKTKDMLIPSTEYSCQVELSLTADFEGSVPKQKLLKKLRTELVAAIKEGVTTTAREFRLTSGGVHVQPIRIECAVNDMGTPEEEPELESETESEPVAELTKPKRKSRR
jgi:hypothetical protein